jgi:hypothetical protein
MQVTISCFLCPSTKDCLDTKYTLQLGDLEKACTFDVCQLVYKHLILGTTKTINFIRTRERKHLAIDFCSYALAVSMLVSFLSSLFFGGLISFSFENHSYVSLFVLFFVGVLFRLSRFWGLHCWFWIPEISFVAR